MSVSHFAVYDEPDGSGDDCALVPEEILAELINSFGEHARRPGDHWRPTPGVSRAAGLLVDMGTLTEFAVALLDEVLNTPEPYAAGAVLGDVAGHLSHSPRATLLCLAAIGFVRGGDPALAVEAVDHAARVEGARRIKIVGLSKMILAEPGMPFGSYRDTIVLALTPN